MTSPRVRQYLTTNTTTQQLTNQILLHKGVVKYMKIWLWHRDCATDFSTEWHASCVQLFGALRILATRTSTGCKLAWQMTIIQSCLSGEAKANLEELAGHAHQSTSAAAAATHLALHEHAHGHLGGV